MDNLRGERMSWLPRDTILGELTIEETFAFYDGPRLFVARSLTDQAYLVAWATEGEDSDFWLYMPISTARLAMVRSGGISAHRAFLDTEGPLWGVTLSHDPEQPDSVEPLSPANLADDQLPAPNYSIGLPTETKPHAVSVDEVGIRARQEGRTRLRLEVEIPFYLRTEAPSRLIGQLLLSTQNTYDNIGLALSSDDPPQRGPIPTDISMQTSSQVLELAAASFVIELAATQQDDLLGDSLFAQATQQLVDLLDQSLEIAEITTKLQRLRPRAAKSFRRFVTELAGTGGDVSMVAAGSTFEPILRELPGDRLQSLVSLLTSLVPEADTYEVRGLMRLYRADLERKVFGVRDEAADVSYEGKISDQAVAQVDHATINEAYEALILVTTVLDEVVGEEKITYQLAQLAPAGTTS
ncbi:MAG TPA: DUF6575 domain-containing protein [Mycobacteriales bacterium]|nr:DUF6575 domain-containing protein [Mycobacteriales bacterium]